MSAYSVTSEQKKPVITPVITATRAATIKPLHSMFEAYVFLPHAIVTHAILSTHPSAGS